MFSLSLRIGLGGKCVTTQGLVFSLLSNLTAAILFVFFVITAAREVIWDPIRCSDIDYVESELLDYYCWVQPTFVVTSGNSDNSPHPGVKPFSAGDNTRHAQYYQWVALCLLFQSILFYAPRWLWQKWGASKISDLTIDPNVAMCSEDVKNDKKNMLLNYLTDNLEHHDWWIYKYFVCELLAICNVIGQLFLMDSFFDGAFFTFGRDLVSLVDQDDRVDPLIFVFPRVTKCIFRKFGPSGVVQRYDTVCILPLNSLNEKIYIFLFFWLVVMTVLATLLVIYRVVLFFTPQVISYLFYLRFRLVHRDAIDTIVRRSRIGDWFLLHMLGQNMDSMIFKDVIHELALKIGHFGKELNERL